MIAEIGWKIRNNHITWWLCRHLTGHGEVFPKGGNWAGGKVCFCGTYVRFDDEVEE